MVGHPRHHHDHLTCHERRRRRPRRRAGDRPLSRQRIDGRPAGVEGARHRFRRAGEADEPQEGRQEEGSATAAPGPRRGPGPRGDRRQDPREEDPASQALHRSDPAQRHGDRRQDPRRQGAVRGDEGVRSRHPRHPGRDHRDPAEAAVPRAPGQVSSRDRPRHPADRAGAPPGQEPRDDRAVGGRAAQDPAGRERSRKFHDPHRDLRSGSGRRGLRPILDRARAARRFPEPNATQGGGSEVNADRGVADRDGGRRRLPGSLRLGGGARAGPRRVSDRLGRSHRRRAHRLGRLSFIGDVGTAPGAPPSRPPSARPNSPWTRPRRPEPPDRRPKIAPPPHRRSSESCSRALSATRDSGRIKKPPAAPSPKVTTPSW